MYVNTSPVACTGLANTDLSRGRLVCSADVDSRSDDLSSMLASLPFRQYAWDRPAFRQLYRVDGAPSLEGTSTHAPTHAPTGIALGDCSRAIEALGERPRTVTGPSEATNLRVATASFISALQSRVQSRALHAGVLLVRVSMLPQREHLLYRWRCCGEQPTSTTDARQPAYPTQRHASLTLTRNLGRLPRVAVAGPTVTQ